MPRKAREMGRKDKRREFVSAIGEVCELVKKLSDAVREQGGDDDDLLRVLKPGSSLPRQFAELVMACRPRAMYPVTVECADLTLPDMIKAGKYDHVNHDITAERFPIGDKNYSVELILVHFGRNMTFGQVEIELLHKGLRVGKIEELLALGVDYPNLSQDPIICLGSSTVINEGLYMPSLYGRELHLDLAEGGWDRLCRFLAVRK